MPASSTTSSSSSPQAQHSETPSAPNYRHYAANKEPPSYVDAEPNAYELNEQA